MLQLRSAASRSGRAGNKQDTTHRRGAEDAERFSACSAFSASPRSECPVVFGADSGFKDLVLHFINTATYLVGQQPSQVNAVRPATDKTSTTKYTKYTKMCRPQTEIPGSSVPPRGPSAAILDRIWQVSALIKPSSGKSAPSAFPCHIRSRMAQREALSPWDIVMGVPLGFICREH